MKNQVLFRPYAVDLGKLDLGSKVPVHVPKDFYTFKKDYGIGGGLVKYCISRLEIKSEDLLKYNDFEMLFITVADETEEMIERYCNGKYTFGEIEVEIEKTYDIGICNNLMEDFIKLTKLGVLFWVEDKKLEVIENFRHELLENYHASALGSEILYSYIYKKYGIPYMFAPSKFTFVITDKCNAKCRTCYRGQIKTDKSKKYDKELTTDEIKSVILQLKKMGVDRLKFLGGEPFCRADLFEILNEAHRHNMVTEVSSNGVLIAQDKFINEIKKLNKVLFNLQISIDGMEKGQETQRTGATFKKVIEAFDKLKSAGIKFSTNTIVSRTNMHELEELIKMVASYDISSRFQIMKACGTGYEHFKDIPSPEEKKQIIEMINNAKVKYNAKINNSIKFHPFIEEDNKESSGGSKYHRCRATTYGMALSPQGYALACEFLEPFPAFIDENVRDKNILDIWHESEMFRNLRYIKVQGRCQACEYNHICEMGCFAETYGLTKDINVSDPVCWYIPKSKHIEYPNTNDYIIENVNNRII